MYCDNLFFTPFLYCDNVFCTREQFLTLVLYSRAGFHDWPFLTVFCWGEAPAGVWELEIQNEGRYVRILASDWSRVVT